MIGKRGSQSLSKYSRKDENKKETIISLISIAVLFKSHRRRKWNAPPKGSFFLSSYGVTGADTLRGDGDRVRVLGHHRRVSIQIGLGEEKTTCSQEHGITPGMVHIGHGCLNIHTIRRRTGVRSSEKNSQKHVRI